MGIDDLGSKLGGGQGEKLSDSAIEKGEDAASQKTGGKGDAAIDKAGNAADERIGGQ